jgi:hypothetical protein
MPGQINWGTPGQTTLSETVENEIFWGAEFPRLILHGGMTLSSTAADAGNTPTTLLRAGLILAEETTGNELSEWNHDATDGSQNIYGILTREINTLGFDAVAADQQLEIALRGPVKAGELLVEGSALVGHANEYIARRSLHSQGFILDDDPQGYLAGANWREKHQNGDLTLTAADNATRYLCHTADADFIMPTIVDGLVFEMVMLANFELQISATGLVAVPGDAVADGVTYTTTGEQYGVHLRVAARNANGTLKWHVTVLKTPFSTDDYLAVTIDT